MRTSRDTCARYDRSKLRYPSDLTDEEWMLVKSLIPPAKHGGRRRTVVVREVVNGVMYVLRARLPVAVSAQGPASKEHSARLPDALEL